MIIDGFTFFNEYDLLECRLEYLYDHVDYFVLSECNYTHSGKPKPLNYFDNISRYSKYKDKILYAPLIIDPTNYKFDVKITECDYSTDYWTLERQQRNNIATALSRFDDDATVLITDLDEIPNPEIFPMIQEELKTKIAVSMVQQSFYYDLNHRHQNFGWAFPAAGKKKDIVLNTANWFRAFAMQINPILNGGWHLSYFADVNGILTKLANTAHQELNNGYTNNAERIEYLMKNSVDPLGRTDIILENPDRNVFSEEFLRVFGKYYKDRNTQ